MLGTNATIPKLLFFRLENLVTTKSRSHSSLISDGSIIIFSPDHFWLEFTKGYLTASALNKRPLIKKASSCVVADISILCLDLEKEPNVFTFGLYGEISIVLPDI